MAKLEYMVPQAHLDDLAIRDANAKIEAATGRAQGARDTMEAEDLSALVQALPLGRLLAQRKAAVGHGNWAGHADSQDGWPAERTRQDYMRLARHFRSAADLPGGVLSIRAALKYLQDRERPRSGADERGALREAAFEAIVALRTLGGSNQAGALLDAWNRAMPKGHRITRLEVAEAADMRE